MDYQYDAASRRTLLTVTGLPTVGYQYDSANRLTQVAQETTTVGLSYDAADRRTSVTLPNGVVQSYSYDDADELAGINFDHGSTHIGDLAYTYDQAGRRISESGSLASLGIPSSVSSATYDADNRLTNWNGIPLAYDANGNLGSYGSSSYSWNTRDELIGTSDGGGSFSYDAFGRRTSQTAVGVTTPYLYDGENPATISGYMLLNGLGLDERFAETSPAGTSSYLSDALGARSGSRMRAGRWSAAIRTRPMAKRLPQAPLGHHSSSLVVRMMGRRTCTTIGHDTITLRLADLFPRIHQGLAEDWISTPTLMETPYPTGILRDRMRGLITLHGLIS